MAHVYYGKLFPNYCFYFSIIVTHNIYALIEQHVLTLQYY